MRPNVVEPYRILAWMKLNGGGLAGASTDITRGLNVNAQDKPLRALAAELSLRQGKATSAVKQATDLLIENPGLALVYRIRAFAWLELGNVDFARVDFHRATELAPSDAAGWSGLAHAYHLQRRYDDALDVLGKAVELEPHYGPAYLLRARAHAAQNDQAAADADRIAAFGIDPGLKLAIDRPGGWRLKNRISFAEIQP